MQMRRTFFLSQNVVGHMGLDSLSIKKQTKYYLLQELPPQESYYRYDILQYIKNSMVSQEPQQI